jgi:putative transcriptional regulator
MVTMQPAPGSLLIASATLLDPNFSRCVLLVLDADSNGTLGVILNRPSEVPVGEVLESWRDVPSEPDVLFRGGPVELNAALAVGSIRGGADADPPPGWRPLTGALGIVDLDASPDELLGRLTALRVYAGYTGWGAEQLEGEIAEGSWHVVPALEGDAFSSHPDRLWRDVLRRQPSPLSLLATLPEDANLN